MAKKKATVVESKEIKITGQEKKSAKSLKIGKGKKLKADTGGVAVSGESIFSETTWGKLKDKHGSEKDLLGKLSAKDGRGSQ